MIFCPFFARFFLLVFWHDIISNFVPVFGSCCHGLLPERSSPERRAEVTGEALAYIAGEEEEVAREEFTGASERRKEKP